MKPLVDTILDRIGEIHTVNDVINMASTLLAQQHINAVAHYPDVDSRVRPTPRADMTVAIDDTDYIDADDYVNSGQFLSSVAKHERCPEWLHRAIVVYGLRH